MNDAFESAFYQLDQDRDGVVTLKDLQRYVKENNLKDKFIQKWLTLFGDEKNIIYYDKFCETLGIIPALDKFEQKTYRIDMTEETKDVVISTMNKYREKDAELSSDTLRAIKKDLSKNLGDKWKVKINPSKNDTNVDYAPDGFLFYSPNLEEKPKILIYRKPEKSKNGHTGIIYNKDMSDETEESIYEIISKHKSNNEILNSKNVSNIISDLEKKHGDKWGMILNPTEKDLNVQYEEDGILFCSLDKTENPKVLVWRKSSKDDKFPGIIYKKDMSNKTEGSINKILSQHKSKDQLDNKNINKMITNIEEENGDKWGLVLNPTPQELKVRYKDDGMLYCSLDETEQTKLLIWRKAPKSDMYSGNIYKKDMTKETEESIENIIFQHISKYDHLEKENLPEIINDIENKNGDKWGIVINPSSKELEVIYKEDGILYCSVDETEEPKFLIWRKPKENVDDSKEIIYESIMSDSVKEGVLKSFHENYNPSLEKLPKSEKIIKELNEKYGPSWNVLLNPTEKQLTVDFDYDGKLYFSPKSNEKIKALIWRQDKEKTRGKMCFCCF